MTGKTLTRLLYVVVIVLPLLWGCGGRQEEPPLARHGVLDLSGWDLEKDGPVDLAGEWEFYWGQLLIPADFHGARPPKITGYLTLPSAWNDFKLQGKKLGGTGYATLRLRLIPGPGHPDLALHLINVASAYHLWLNGRPFAASGVVGRKAAAEIPNHSILMPRFHQEGSPIELVLQVSNYHYRQGGVISPIQLGPQGLIEAGHLQKWGLALFFVGSLLVMGVYHLVLFWFRRTNRAPLYFGLYCLLWMGNFLAADSSEWAIRLFWPQVSMPLLDRLNLICFFLSVPVGYLFFRSLYPEEFSTLILRFSEILAAGFVLLALFTSTLALTTALPAYYLYSCLLILYCLAMLHRARSRGREEATFLLAGFLVLGLVGANDMLYDLRVIHSVPLIHVGMFVFILFQAFALSRRFSRAFSSVERLSAELEDNNLALSRLDRIKDEFLANTSHELRTPLSGIIGLSESLLNGAAGPLPSKAAGDLTMVAASARRLSGLVNDILDFSLLKNRDLALDKKAVDLRGLTSMAFAVSQPLAQSKGLQLVNAIPGGLPCVAGDEDRVLQILFNLIGNAIKFTNRGEIKVAAATRGDLLELAVSDTGPGIPADRLEAIFLPFEQIDASAARAANGVGLGLAISRHLAELHGGRLWAESILGVGSVFRLTLPVCAAPAETAAPSQTAPPAPSMPAVIPAAEPGSASRPGPAAPRILVVDDDPVNLQVVRNHLELEGMAVTTAATGREALARIDEGETFDLVLLDVMMPGMTGLEVCRELRRSSSVTELPVILLTALTRMSDLAAGFECGANDYLPKPFAREELLARTRAQLEVRRAGAEARRASQLAMLGELAAGIAHEVNTPINTIINSSELLLTADSREELEHDARIIRSEGRRIAGIVGGLLSFARRGQGEKTACSVARIVADTVSLVQAKLRKEHIRLLVEVPDDLPDVQANHQQLLQVALNLINNAAQALNDKYPDAHADKIIRLGGERVQLEGGTMVRLYFHDQGPGIPARLLDQVMTPFFTTKPPGQGTGLGLSIAHGIIADHGGALRLTSIEGTSTTVTIDLPAAEGEPEGA